MSTIYSSYSIFLKSFQSISKNAINVAKGFGASSYLTFLKIHLPNAMGMAPIAFRLAIGRALLGAIIGQYLLSGNGLGGLIGQTRAQLDFRVVWFICSVVALLTLFFLLTTIVRLVLMLISLAAAIPKPAVIAIAIAPEVNKR